MATINFTPQPQINRSRALAQILAQQAAAGPGPLAARSSLSPIASALQGITAGLHGSHASRAEEQNQQMFSEAVSGISQAGTDRNALARFLMGTGHPQLQQAGLQGFLNQPSDLDRQLKEAQLTKTQAETTRLGQPEPPKPADIAGMRKEFTNLFQDFRKVRDAFGRVQASAQQPSAAGDLALIFNYMKILDPGSVVREGEFANAENSAGVPDQVRNIYNRVMTGERLADPVRQDFVDRAGMLFGTQQAQHQKLRGVFESLATRQGFDPRNIVPDFSPAVPQSPAAAAGAMPNRTVGGMIPPQAVQFLKANAGNTQVLEQFRSKYGQDPAAFLR